MTSAMYQPDYTAALGLITHLSNDELKEMLNDDSKFESMLKNMNQFKSLESEKEMLLVQINSLAECNLTREPQLLEGKQKIKDMSERGEELTKIVEEKLQELKSKNGDMSVETALALLQAAAAEMEEESEKIASNLLDGSLDIEDFLQQFAEIRKIMHLRKVKADKMSELISRRPLVNHVPNYINAPPVNINSNYFPSVPNANSTPYPSSNLPYPNMGNANSAPYPGYPSVGMPMPGSYFANNF